MKKTVLGHPVVRFPTREQGNSLYPLPPDYDSLTADGQRLARVNACSLQDTPEDFVWSWSFFRSTYLFPQWRDGAWQDVPGSLFYHGEVWETARMHYEIVHSMAKYPLSVYAAPRGFAKTNILQEVVLMTSTTRHKFRPAICKASEGLVEDDFSNLQQELENNEYLIQDFGRLKGTGMWNLHTLQLANGSIIRGFPVEGRKRGLRPRPDWIILDDPEYDAKGTTDTVKLRRDFETLLFKVLMNMCGSNVRLSWAGTMISKQGFLWVAANAADPRFKSWFRRVYRAYATNETGTEFLKDIRGNLIPTWPDWHYRGLRGIEALEAKKQDIGTDPFASEYLNMPGSGTDATFTVDPELHYYFIEGDHLSDPLNVTEKVAYKTRNKTNEGVTEHSEPFGDLVRKMFRIMAMDYAPTVTPTSDFSCIMVLGFMRPLNILWVLDLFLKRIREDGLMEEMWRMGLKWRPQVVGIEAISIQERVYEVANSLFRDRAEKVSWMPKVFPVRYPGASRMSKQNRIAGLQWRFNGNRILLPGHLRTVTPWRELFRQIEEFRADTADGNLDHDDAIDTLAQSQFIVRPTGALMQGTARSAETALDKLAAGRTHDERTGLPLIGGLNADEIPPETLRALYNREADLAEERRQIRALPLPMSGE